MSRIPGAGFGPRSEPLGIEVEYLVCSIDLPDVDSGLESGFRYAHGHGVNLFISRSALQMSLVLMAFY